MWWVHDITLHHVSGQVDDYGQSLPAQDERLKAWVEASRIEARTKDGQDVTYTTSVYIPGARRDVRTGSTVTIPGGETITVLAVDVMDAGGLALPTHTVLRCQ